MVKRRFKIEIIILLIVGVVAGWIAPAFAAVTGTVYTDEGVTNAGSGLEVIVVSGGANVGSATTNASGAFSITATLSAGTPYLLYVNSSSLDATTASLSSGANMTGVDLYSDHVIVRSDNGGSLTNANMSTAKGSYSDNEILYTVAAGALTVTPVSELYVASGHSFTPGGNVTTASMESKGTFVGGNFTLAITTNIVIGGGSFTAPSASGSFTVGQDFTVSAGTYTHNSGTVTFNTDGGNVSAFNTGSAVFNNVTIVKGNNDITLTGTMNIDGNLTLTSADALDGGTYLVGGNISTADTGILGTSAITLDGTGAQTITSTGSGVFPAGTFTINKASGTASLASDLSLNRAGQDLTVTSGTLDLAGFNLTVNDVLTNAAAGTLKLKGNETVTYTTLTFNAGSTVLYYGTTGPYTVKNWSYKNLTFNGAATTFNLGAALNLAENLTITAGTLDVTATNYAVNVTGNFSNSGTFTARSGTFTLNGTNQTISGNTTFNNLTKSVATARTLTFAAGSTTTVNGTATLNGAAGQLLSLRSSTPGTRWNFTLGASATKSISYVDVQDSDASGSAASKIPVLPSNSTDSGNNVAWFGITISGTVYTDEGSTNIGSGKTVRLLANGSSVGTAATNASGQFTISGTVSTGDAILLYIDGNDGTTTDATTVSVSPGGVLNNIDLYVDHLVVRHDNAGSLTNALMNTAKGAYVDTEILYSVSAGALTVSGAATELYVPTSHSYTPGGDVTTPNLESKGTFSGGSGSITSSGALVVSGGSFTATSGITSIGGGVTVSGGTYTHNSGTVTLTGTSSQAVSIGATSLNHVILNGGASNIITVTGSMDINGNLTVTQLATLNTGTLTVAGNVTTTDASVDGSAMITFDGGGAQTLSASGGTGALPAVTVNKSAGTLTLQDTIELDGSGGWTYTTGTVSAGTSTVVLNSSSSLPVSSGAMSFNNVTYNMGAGTTVTITGTMDINGNLTFTAADTINTGTMTVAGNLSSTDSAVTGTAAITLDGTGAQSITAGSADLPDGTLTINKASGTATLAANLTLNSAGQDITVTAGTLDLAGFNLVLTGAGDVITVSNGATLQLQGGETVTASTKTMSSGSTVIYNGAGSYTGLKMGNAYHHLTFNSSGNWTLNSALDANGNLTISAGTLATGGNTINVAGNWSNSGTFTHGSSTVTLDGASQSITGNTTFNNLTKSVASAATLTFAASSTTTVNGTATLNGAVGQLLSLRSGTPGTRWNFILTASVTKAISYVDVQDSDASGSDASKKPVNPTNSADSGNSVSWFQFQPDAMIRLSSEGDGAYLTDNTYEATASVQVKSQGVVSSSTASYYVKFQNDATVTDSLVITGTATGSSFTVQYLDDTSTDRTAFVIGAGYTIASLAAGTSKVWTVNVTPAGNPTPVTGGTAYNVFVTATSSSDSNKTDQVKATTTSTSANLTLLKNADKGNANPGDDISYTTSAMNGSGLTDASSIVLSDPIPTYTGFKVGGATFNAGTSTLTSSISYSNDNGTSWTYTPASGGCSAPAGYDYCVTDVRWAMTGTMPSGSSFSVGLVVRVK